MDATQKTIRRYGIIACLVVVATALLLFRTEDPAALAWLLLLGSAFFIRPFIPMERSVIDLAVLLLCGYCSISCLTGINAWGSLPMMRQAGICFLGYIIVRKLQMHPSSRRIFFGGMLVLFGVALILAFCSFGVFRHAVETSGFSSTYPFRFLFRPIGYNTNAWATVLLALTGLILAAPSFRHFPRWCAPGIIGLTWIAILLSFSRGAYLAWVVLVGLLLVIFRRRARKKLALVSLVVILTVCCGFPRETWTTLRMNHTSSQQQSTQGRMEATRAAWEAWKEHPWLGVGAGNYTLAVDSQLSRGMTRPFTTYAPNVAVRILTEGGIIGCALALFLVGSVGWFIVKKRKDRRTLVIGAVLLALLIKEMTLDTLATTPAGMLLVAMLLAILQWDRKWEEPTFVWIEDTRLHHAVWTACLLCYGLYGYFAITHSLDEKKNRMGWEYFLNRDWDMGYTNIEQTSKEVPYLINRVLLHTDVEEHWRGNSFVSRSFALLEEAEEKQPEDIHIAFMKAKITRLARNYPKADSMMAELTEKYPENVLYRYEAYRLLKESGRKKEAVEELEEAVRLMPRLLELDSIVRLEKEDAGLYDTLMHRLFIQKPSPDALPSELARYGAIAYRCGESEEAEYYLKEAVEQMPGLSVPWFLLSRICKETGREEEAESCLRKYRLLEHGAFAMKDKPLDSLKLEPFHERDLWKEYAIRFKTWYRSDLFVIGR